MKRLISVLLAVMVLGAIVLSASADSDRYFAFYLQKIIQGGETYWAKDTNVVCVRLNEEKTVKMTGIYTETEDPAETYWGFTENGNKAEVIIDGTVYCFDVNSKDPGITLTYHAEGRDLVYVMKNSKAYDEEPAGDMLRVMDTLAVLDAVEKVCPVDRSLWSGTAVKYRWPDCCSVVTFETDYGPARYVVDQVTDEVVDGQDPDIEGARAREGFREPLNSDQIYEIVSNRCPLEYMSDGKIRQSRSADGAWRFYIDTAYGEFYYEIDGYTGEILDAVEPDMDEARAQEGFVEPLSGSEAIDLAAEQTGLEHGKITGRHVKKTNSHDYFTVTLNTVYGEFIYKIDRTTRKVLEKTEPDVDAVKAQEGFTEPMDTDEAMRLAEQMSGLSFEQITKRKGSRKADGSIVITLGSIYGDFMYHFDINTREVLEKEEPDIEAVRSQEGFAEPLGEEEIIKIAVEAAGLKRQDVSHESISLSNSVWRLTLDVVDGRQFYFEIDGMSGEILDRIDPEEGGSSGAAEEAPKSSGDVFGDAINACTGSLEGYDYTAANIKVGMKEKNGQQFVSVKFTWHGKDYDMVYSVADGKVVTDQ